MEVCSYPPLASNRMKSMGLRRMIGSRAMFVEVVQSRVCGCARYVASGAIKSRAFSNTGES